jgi:hypothetical protein
VARKHVVLEDIMDQCYDRNLGTFYTLLPFFLILLFVIL